MIPVVVHGAEGRMGQLITTLVDSAEDMELVGLVTEPGRHQEVGVFHDRLPLLGQEEMGAKLPSGAVIVDFSLSVALDGLIQQARQMQSPMVMGTTGFTADQEQTLHAYSDVFALVHANNFSVGIPALQLLLQLLAKTLPSGFDAEQVETHHITKLDKPSGTAKHLAATYAAARGAKDLVPTHSQRLGGTIGEHTWTFSDAEETLVLTHRAHSRQAFLRGILPSVRFVQNRAAGRYGLTQVLQSLVAES